MALSLVGAASFAATSSFTVAAASEFKVGEWAELQVDSRLILYNPLSKYLINIIALIIIIPLAYETLGVLCCSLQIDKHN